MDSDYTDQLISAVFAKKALWDQRDKYHHNRYVLDKLWDAVAREMKTTTTIARSKWKNLRDHFRKELKKNPVVRSGDAGSNVRYSSWPYFESLQFLKDQFTARTSDGNLSQVINKTSVVLDAYSDTAETTHTDSESITMSEQVDDIAEPETSEAPNRIASVGTASTSQKKRKREAKDIGTALCEIEQYKIKLMESQYSKPLDDDRSFFDSLLPEVKALPSNLKMLFRLKVQQMLYEMRYNTEQQPPAYNRGQNLTNLRTATPSTDYSNPLSAASLLTNFNEQEDSGQY